MTSQPGQHRRRMRTPTYALASPLGILSFFGLDEYSRLERKYAREVAEGTGNKDFESELKNVLKMGILDMRKGNYDKAESLFHIGLTMATDMQHQNGITYVLDLMANLALERKEYEKAERLFVNVMQRLIGLRGLSETDDAIVEMALKMASIHQGQGQHEKAEMGYSFCVHTQKAKFDELKAGGSTLTSNSNAESDNTTALYGMSLDAHGRYLMDQGRVKAAKDRFETALAVSVGLYGEQSEQALAMSNSLATCYSMLGMTERADEVFKKVVATARRLPSDHLASYLVNSGLHQLKKAAFGPAQKLCFESSIAAWKAGDIQVQEEAEDCLRKARAKKSL